MMKYDTDKHEDLIPAYEKLFADIRHEKLKILEVGVLRGGSMRWLSNYFPNSEIYGIDIVLPDIKVDRVKMLQIDQNDNDKLENLATIGFDIIIDDGCHYPKETKNTFDVLWKATKHYIVEDWDAGINNPAKYAGLEQVVFDITKRRLELGIKELIIYTRKKSYAYFKK